MWGQYSYLLSALIFAGIPVLFECIFFYQILLKYQRVLVKMVGIFLLMTPVVEYFAISSNAWKFSEERSLGIFIFGSFIETLVVTILITLSVSIITIVWMQYVDRGLPIFSTGFRDIISGKYAVWSGNSHKK